MLLLAIALIFSMTGVGALLYSGIGEWLRISIDGLRSLFGYAQLKVNRSDIPYIAAFLCFATLVLTDFARRAEGTMRYVAALILRSQWFRIFGCGAFFVVIVGEVILMGSGMIHVRRNGGRVISRRRFQLCPVASSLLFCGVGMDFLPSHDG